MKPDQLNHLKLIDAHLDKLLALAAKRTAGKWTLGDENNSHYEICMGDAIATIDRQDRYGLHMAISREEMRANGGFIIDCAGNAEAGWVATKGMIMLIFGYEELSKTLTAPLTLEAVNIARDSILESILIAWPLTRITP